MTETLLEVENLQMYIDTPVGAVHAVEDISFSVKRGEVFALVGESGSGKTMTGLSVMGLQPRPQGKIVGGSVRWKGQELVGADDDTLRKLRGQEIAMIFQDALTALNPVYTVGAQIVEMIRNHQDISIDDAKARVVEVLSLVGIPEPKKRAESYPHELSGGMRQRAMIAMAIANEPDLLIADEPTTALDVTVQAQVLELLEEIQERTQCAMVLITHDLGIVAGRADRVMVMYGGRTVETCSTDEIFYDNRHPYTRGLLNSLPGRSGDRLEPISGQPPSLLRLPSGCAFHPRCPRAELPNPCAEVRPELLAVSSDHLAACHFANESQS